MLTKHIHPPPQGRSEEALGVVMVELAPLGFGDSQKHDMTIMSPTDWSSSCPWCPLQGLQPRHGPLLVPTPPGCPFPWEHGARWRAWAGFLLQLAVAALRPVPGTSAPPCLAPLRDPAVVTQTTHSPELQAVTGRATELQEAWPGNGPCLTLNKSFPMQAHQTPRTEAAELPKLCTREISPGEQYPRRGTSSGERP